MASWHGPGYLLAWPGPGDSIYRVLDPVFRVLVPVFKVLDPVFRVLGTYSRSWTLYLGPRVPYI